MAIGKQDKDSHDKTASHGSTSAHQLGPGKQSLVDSHGHGDVKAEAASAHKPTKKELENEATFQLGAYGQRIVTAYNTVKDRVGRSKSVQQAASAALGAAGGLLADKLGAEVGKGLGTIIGKITEKVGESLGEKAPEIKGDENAAAYIGGAGKKAYDAVHSVAHDIPNHHLTVAQLNQLLTFLHSADASSEGIGTYVKLRLSAYQNSVELMYQHPEQLNPIHNELVAQTPTLGRVPDPHRNNVPHLAVVQATTHHITGDSPLTTWALRNFIAPGLGPEANAVMAQTHPGEKIRDFKLKTAGRPADGLILTKS